MINTYNDNSIAALVAVTGRTQSIIQCALAAEGRITSKHINRNQIFRALTALGFIYSEKQLVPSKNKVSVSQVKQFPKMWKNGSKYLVFTKKQVFCLNNGEIVSPLISKDNVIDQIIKVN